jgi:hypothetical protein
MWEDIKWSTRWTKKVLLNVNNFNMPKGLTLKFMSKVGASFSIVKQMFKDIYKLELPANIKVHLTFHASCQP